MAQRAECSPAAVFEALAQIVERDVEEFNNLDEDLRRRFTCKVERHEEGTGPFLMIHRERPKRRLGNHGYAWLSLGLKEKTSIFFEGTNRDAVTLQPRLAGGGSCWLHDNGNSYELWELSRHVLEPFFFD